MHMFEWGTPRRTVACQVCRAHYDIRWWWSCLSCHGIGPLVILCDTMTDELYCNMLDNEVMCSTIWTHVTFRMIMPVVMLMHSLCSGMRTTTFTDWTDPFRATLNHVRHLWYELEYQVRSRLMHPTSVEQMHDILQEEWRNLPGSILHQLAKSSLQQVTAIIAAWGIDQGETSRGSVTAGSQLLFGT